MRVFLAEKGITNVPFEQVNLRTADNRKPEFLKINPMGGIPVLELDDGTHIAESVAICRYFETIEPEPPLMGVDAKDKALVKMWNRRMEFEILGMTSASFRNTSDFFEGHIPQVKEYGEIAKNAAIKRLEWLNTVLANREFVAGPRYTIADITALIGIDFGRTDPMARSRKMRRTLRDGIRRYRAAPAPRPSASRNQQTLIASGAVRDERPPHFFSAPRTSANAVAGGIDWRVHPVQLGRVNDHARHRHVHPQRPRPSRDSAVASKVAFEWEPNRREREAERSRRRRITCGIRIEKYNDRTHPWPLKRTLPTL